MFLSACGYKDSYKAYTEAVVKVPKQETLSIHVDPETNAQTITYTDPRDRIILKPPEHNPVFGMFSNIIGSVAKVWAIVAIGDAVSDSVKSISNRPESTKEVYVEKNNSYQGLSEQNTYQGFVDKSAYQGVYTESDIQKQAESSIVNTEKTDNIQNITSDSIFKEQ